MFEIRRLLIEPVVLLVMEGNVRRSGGLGLSELTHLLDPKPYLVKITDSCGCHVGWKRFSKSLQIQLEIRGDVVIWTHCSGIHRNVECELTFRAKRSSPFDPPYFSASFMWMPC